jgi:tRNA(His) 5'-end guanylyltransferase
MKFFATEEWYRQAAKNESEVESLIAGGLMRDELGNRMKEQYEDRTRQFLPRRTYTIIRVDGRAFHTYTRHCKRPFDSDLMDDMDGTAIHLCENVSGARFAFVQSDEISLLLTDFENNSTEAWFNGNVQKMTSVSASLATAQFNQFRLERQPIEELFTKAPAYFDSRVFTIPDPIEVCNYFIWRQKDATRNSVQMVARSLYSHKELMHKNSNELQEMIFQKGQNWNDYSVGCKRGRVIKKTWDGERSNWIVVEPPEFTKDWDFLTELIPTHEIT